MPVLIGEPENQDGADDTGGQSIVVEHEDDLTIEFQFVNQGSEIDIVTYHIGLPTLGTEGGLRLNEEATRDSLPADGGFELVEQDGEWVITGPLGTGEQSITVIVEAVAGGADQEIESSQIQLTIRDENEEQLLNVSASVGNNIFIPAESGRWFNFLPWIGR